MHIGLQIGREQGLRWLLAIARRNQGLVENERRAEAVCIEVQHAEKGCSTELLYESKCVIIEISMCSGDIR